MILIRQTETICKISFVTCFKNKYKTEIVYLYKDNSYTCRAIFDHSKTIKGFIKFLSLPPTMAFHITMFFICTLDLSLPLSLPPSSPMQHRQPSHSQLLAQAGARHVYLSPPPVHSLFFDLSRR